MPLLSSIVGYWKLDEASGTRNDSHGTAHLTQSGSPSSTTGKLNDAASFNGTAMQLASASDTTFSFGDTDASCSLWVRLNTKATFQSIFSTANFNVVYNSGLDRFVCNFILPSSSQGVTANALGSPSTGTWYHIVCRHNATTDTISITVNSTNTNSVSNNLGLSTSAGVVRVSDSGGNFLDGDVDEVGVWNKYLSDDEVAELYNSGGTPPSYDTFQDDQALAGTMRCQSTFSGSLTVTEAPACDDYVTGYAKRKKITVDHTNVDSDLTDFPLLVKITDDAEIGAVAHATGQNIRFTSSDGITLLKYERESFSVTGGEATGIFWVKVPTISGSANTDIYIYYDNSSAVDGEDAENVWVDFRQVNHLQESASGPFLDSTSNNVDGTASGGLTSVAGTIGNAIDLDGTNDTHISFSNQSLGSAFAISLIATPATLNLNRQFVSTWNTTGWVFRTGSVSSAQQIEFFDGTNNHVTAGNHLSAGVKSYVAVTLTGSTYTIYHNGVSVYSGSGLATPQTGPGDMLLGNLPGAGTFEV
jgi:hypothetical protein